jgi:hypothetical protein
VIEGLDRWLAEIERSLGDVDTRDPVERFRLAGEAIATTERRHVGLARNFVGALARAQHDDRVREMLADGFRRTRPSLASLLGLGEDQAGEDAAALVHSLFVGLVFQGLLDQTLAVKGERMERAQVRLLRVLPGRVSSRAGAR